MFLQASVCPQGGGGCGMRGWWEACMVAGGDAWRGGACVAEGSCMVAGGPCMAGGACVAGACMVRRGSAWQGGMHGQWGECMARVCVAGGACVATGCCHRGHAWSGGARMMKIQLVNARVVRILLECILVISLYALCPKPVYGSYWVGFSLPLPMMYWTSLYRPSAPPFSPGHQAWEPSNSSDIWWPSLEPVQTCSFDDPPPPTSTDVLLNAFLLVLNLMDYNLFCAEVPFMAPVPLQTCEELLQAGGFKEGGFGVWKIFSLHIYYKKAF